MVSGIVTFILLALFIAGSYWVYRPELKREFDAAARMPLDENEEQSHE